MDDLKLYGKSASVLERQVGIVAEYTEDIGMEFGIEKCAAVQMKEGR